MALQEIRVAHLDTYNFGVGVDRLSGSAMNLAVKPTQSAPDDSLGGSQTIEVSRITSTSQLEEKLGIDVSASYGCASFGAGISGRFSFAHESQVHSASLFMTVTSTVSCPDLSITECVMTDAAASVASQPNLFNDRYGDMFARACKRGGVFVGLLRIETYDDDEANQIESELQGTYGLFSASASANFSKVTSEHKATMYFTVLSEGGPALQIQDPGNPKELLDLANNWLKALIDDPKQYSKPYQWTLSPMTIVEGPSPPDAAQIEHAQDVLMFCATERGRLLDLLNLFNWWVGHQDKYDWTGADTPAAVSAAASAVQQDLDTIAACASSAIRNPANAKMPVDFAPTQLAPASLVYPVLKVPPKGPKPLPGTPAMIAVPDCVHYSGYTDRDGNPMPGLLRGVVDYLTSLGLKYGVQNVTGQRQDDVDMGTCNVISQNPSPDTHVPTGYVVSLQV